MQQRAPNPANDNPSAERSAARLIPLIGEVGPDGRITFFPIARELLAPFTVVPRPGKPVDRF